MDSIPGRPIAPGALNLLLDDLADTDIITIITGAVSAQTTLAVLRRFLSAGGSSWRTVHANTTAVPGDMLSCDTSAGPFTVTFPSDPVKNDTVEVRDPQDTWPTNPLTIDPGPAGIAQDDDDPTLTCQASVRMVFIFNGTTWVINEEIALNTFIPA